MILSKEQKEIIRLLTKEFLTVRQISIRRQTTIQAVYKTIKKLTAIGILKHIDYGVFSLGTRTEKSKIKLFRLWFNYTREYMIGNAVESKVYGYKNPGTPKDSSLGEGRVTYCNHCCFTEAY